MSRLLRRADDFLGDFDHQYQWYLVEAGETVARRYLDAVWRALEELAAEHPNAEVLELIAFIRASKRGVCVAPRGSSARPADTAD